MPFIPIKVENNTLLYIPKKYESLKLLKDSFTVFIPEIPDDYIKQITTWRPSNVISFYNQIFYKKGMCDGSDKIKYVAIGTYANYKCYTVDDLINIVIYEPYILKPHIEDLIIFSEFINDDTLKEYLMEIDENSEYNQNKNVILQYTPEKINEIIADLDLIYNFADEFNQDNYMTIINMVNIIYKLRISIPKIKIRGEEYVSLITKVANGYAHIRYLRDITFKLINMIKKISKLYSPENLKDRKLILSEEQKEELDFGYRAIMWKPNGILYNGHFEHSIWNQDLNTVKNVNPAYRSIYNDMSYVELQQLLIELDVSFPKNYSHERIINYLKRYYERIIVK